MPQHMSDDRLSLALDRLKRALDRVEQAGAALEQEGAHERKAAESLRAEIEDLEQRHLRLRASAASAIEQLDNLIAPARRAEAHHG